LFGSRAVSETVRAILSGYQKQNAGGKRDNLRTNPEGVRNEGTRGNLSVGALLYKGKSIKKKEGVSERG